MNKTSSLLQSPGHARSPAPRRVSRSLRWLLLVMVLALPALAQAFGATIRSGHSGHWYDPARDGEGFMLEILGSDEALLYWFTYDEQGRQRWMIASGHTERGDGYEYLSFPSLIVTRGARFGADFDPEEVQREVVGSATLHFADCDFGEFAFEAFEQALSFPVQRLTHAMGMPCESRHGVPGRVSAEHAGQSGSWFDQTHDGEGYALQWINPETALLTWYSYDTDGEQYWMIGVGELDEQGRLHFPDLVATQGARFGAEFDPDDVERFTWGKLTLDLGCDVGDAHYQSVLAPFGSGSFDLQRLTSPRHLGCPYQAPSLTDLYEISYSRVPFPPWATFTGNPLSVLRLTDDGTLYGIHRTLLDTQTGASRYQLAKLEPGASEWQILPDAEVDTIYPVYASADGRRFARHRVELDEEGTPLTLHFEIREDEGPWLSPDGTPGGYVVFTQAIASNFSAFAGGGSAFGRPGTAPPWRWTPELGLHVLPVPEDTWTYQPAPTAVGSDDGRIVIGSLFAPDPQRGWRTRTLRWVDGGEPETLYDTLGTELSSARTCDSDCTLVFGSNQAFLDRDHPYDRQAWYWRGPGDMAYLGELDVDVDDEFLFSKYGISGASSDGSLAVGAYVSGRLDRPNPIENIATREAMFWTQRTGLVSLATIISELGIEEGEPWTERGAGQITEDGRRILLTGRYFDAQSRFHQRAAILHLQPRSEDW